MTTNIDYLIFKENFLDKWGLVMSLRTLFGFLLLISMFAAPTDVGICQTATSEIGVEKEGPINWGWALTLAGDYDLPLGTYYTNVDPGIGIEFRLARSVSRSTAVRLSISQYGMDFNAGAGFSYTDIVSEPTVYHIMREPHFDVRTLTFGVQYQRWIDPFKRNRTKGYFSLDVGVARQTASGEVQVREAGSNDYVRTYDLSENDQHAILRMGGGLIFPIGNRIQLDIGTDINLVWVKDSNDVGMRNIVYGAKGYIVRMTAGLTYPL